MFLSFKVDLPYESEAYRAVPVLDDSGRMIGCATLLRGTTYRVMVAASNGTMLRYQRAWITPRLQEQDGRGYLSSLTIEDWASWSNSVPIAPEEVTEA